MENPEEILHSLEEFSKMKPKDIPRELEEYLCYVAKTGNPVYQWQTIKSLFREKLLNVITEFYESCPAVDIPPCPNVEIFNYDLMKNFILEKLDTFSAAPFTVQRICELLTTPRKEYNRIDKYMRALEKNILVVSTTEPNLGRRSTENGEGIMNGLESDHLLESTHPILDINVEEMDESPSRPRASKVTEAALASENTEIESQQPEEEQVTVIQEGFENEVEEKTDVITSSISTDPVGEPEQIQQDPVVTCPVENSTAHYVPIENLPLDACTTSQQNDKEIIESDLSLTTSSMSSSFQKVANVDSLEAEALPKPENSIANCDELSEQKPESDGSSENEVINEQISTSVVSSGDSSTDTLVEPSSLSDLQSVSKEEAETTETNILVDHSDAFPETSEIQISSEAEKTEPETTENITFHKETEDLKNEAENEIATSIDETSSEDMTTSAVTSFKPDSENVADSSTSQEEEVSESHVINLENVDSNADTFSEAEETNSIDEPVMEAKLSSDDVPMEVDIISETESREKISVDEPSSTSADINC